MSQATLQRRPLVKEILAGADDNLLVIAGLGSSNWDITNAGDRPLNMPLWGAMGATVGMGLGLAIAQPTKRVLVITGDGDMLMSLGSLATVAAQSPDNLAICVLDNEKFGETGNQATHTSPRNNGPTNSGAGTDLAMIAKGCGIADCGTVQAQADVAQLVKDLRTKKGPVFRLVKVMVEKLEFVMPPQDGAHLKDRFRQALLGSRMMDYAPFPLVELTGSPRERGRQHGQAVPDRIKRGIEMYSESLLKNGVDWKHLEQRANAMVPVVEKFDPAYVEEMRGIAEGAGVPFAGMMLMNARTEMVAAARKQQAQQHFPDGCTAAFALPEASADGVLLHGQNWDWRAECAETGVVLRIRRDDGPDILTFTEAGGLARSGLNSAGIGLTANALECDRDYQRGPGVPLPFIRRKVLESAYLAEAVRTIFATPKLGSNHMAVQPLRRRGLRLRMRARRDLLGRARARHLRPCQSLDRRRRRARR